VLEAPAPRSRRGTTTRVALQCRQATSKPHAYGYTTRDDKLPSSAHWGRALLVGQASCCGSGSIYRAHTSGRLKQCSAYGLIRFMGDDRSSLDHSNLFPLNFF
jgi:hypothetical protein